MAASRVAVGKHGSHSLRDIAAEAWIAPKSHVNSQIQPNNRLRPVGRIVRLPASGGGVYIASGFLS